MILYFQEKYIESDAIKSYEYNEYQPTSGSNLNISGNINIHIENVKYEIVNNPGIAGVLKGIAKYPNDYAYGTGMIQCWSPETPDGAFIKLF